MPLISRRSFLSTALAFAFAAPALRAQPHESALSEAEVEKIRDARLDPAACITLFVKFLDLRVQEIQDLYAKPRRPGREEDTREFLQQFTSIADELGDNLDDYGPRHADLRKALPKLLEGTERWSSALKSPPEDGAYSVDRKLALESIRDLRESTTQLSTEQDAWFKLHPPSKQKEQQAPGPIDIPR
ncbi:MAG TPA: hypothetical protein VHU44_17595 [Acidobacteriaceae bacterium]|nr:hypothetical protein [Acidobacteriaceae bacterium]